GPTNHVVILRERRLWACDRRSGYPTALTELPRSPSVGGCPAVRLPGGMCKRPRVCCQRRLAERGMRNSGLGTKPKGIQTAAVTRDLLISLRVARSALCAWAAPEDGDYR